jgi:hypothetical protein
MGSGLAALFYSIVKFVEFDTMRAKLHLRLHMCREGSSVEIDVQESEDGRGEKELPAGMIVNGGQPAAGGNMV